MNFIHDWKDDKGNTLVTVMAAMVIGGIITAMAAMFWINSGKSATSNAEVSNQEAAALRVLNGVTNEVNQSEAIVYAADKRIVTQRIEDEKVIRTRYHLDTAAKTIVRTQNPNAPTNYTESTSFPTSIKPTTVATKAKDQKLFDYFDSAGNDLPGAVLNAGDTADVKRVDIFFKADAGNGYVELTSKAAVNKRSAKGAGGNPNLPGIQCPDPASMNGSVNSSGHIVINWDGVSDASKYRILRNGTTVATIMAGSNTSHTYTDTNPALGQTNVYSIQPSDGNGFRSGCTTISVDAPLNAPDVSGLVSGTDFHLSWNDVNNASYYKVYERSVNPTTYEATSAWTLNGNYNGTSTVIDGPGNESKEFRVATVADNGAESNSGPFVLKSEPVTPSVSASVPNKTVNINGTSKTVLNYNVNRVVVTAGDMNNQNVTLTRSASGGPLASNQTVTSNLSTPTYTDVLGGSEFTLGSSQQYLGYEYTYRATVSNVGPREGTSAGPRIGSSSTVTKTSPANAASKSLQPPPDPVTTATGSEANPTGSNKVDWEASRSATSYEVWRTWKNVGGSYDDAGGDRFWVGMGASARTFTENYVERGSRHYYMAVARNATGFSPNHPYGSTDRAPAYQKPVAPEAVTFQSAAGRPTIASNTAIIQWDKKRGSGIGGASDNTPAGHLPAATAQPRHPDAAQPADATFCTSATTGQNLCKYEVRLNTTAGNPLVTRAAHTAANRRYTVPGLTVGHTNKVYVRACNYGGCSEDTEITLDTYPSAFSAPDTLRTHGRVASQENPERLNQDTVNTYRDGMYDWDRVLTDDQRKLQDIQSQAYYNYTEWNSSGNEVTDPDIPPMRVPAAVRMRWTDSAGTGVKYAMSVYGENDTVDYKPAAVQTDGGGGRTVVVQPDANHTWNYSGTEDGNGYIATPGSRVYYTVQAHASNGLYRYWDATQDKYRASKAGGLLPGQTASGTYPGVSAQVPPTNPDVIENRSMCRVRKSGSKYVADPAGGWGSALLVDGTVRDVAPLPDGVSGATRRNIKVDYMTVRNGAGMTPSGHSDIEGLARAVWWAYMPGLNVTNGNSYASYEQGGEQGYYHVMDTNQSEATDGLTYDPVQAYINWGNNPPASKYGIRRHSMPTQAGYRSSWFIRGFTTPEPSMQAATPADYGYGWASASGWSDTNWNGSNILCPASVMSSSTMWPGSTWRWGDSSRGDYWGAQKLP